MVPSPVAQAPRVVYISDVVLVMPPKDELGRGTPHLVRTASRPPKNGETSMQV